MFQNCIGSVNYKSYLKSVALNHHFMGEIKHTKCRRRNSLLVRLNGFFTFNFSKSSTKKIPSLAVLITSVIYTMHDTSNHFNHKKYLFIFIIIIVCCWNY